MNNPASELAKKRWSKVKKEDRSNAMRKVRGSFDFSNVILKITPQKIDATKLEEMANGTDKGMEYSIMLALSDGESRTKREINSMVEKIMITSAIELNRREGNMEVSDNFNWFTDWSVKNTNFGNQEALTIISENNGGGV